MKYRIFAILQLGIMVFYLGRPILPYIEYAVFKDYIVKNLCVNRDKPKSCCQGKCHLKKQIEKSNESGDNENNSSNKKVINQEVKEFIASLVVIPKAIAISISRTIYDEITITVQVSSSVFVPPKVSLFS